MTDYTGVIPETRPADWQEDAKCRSGLYSPELWFAEGVTSQAYDDRRYAKAICQSCPVRQQCLKLAVANEAGSHFNRFGIYGGLTPHQRAARYPRKETAA